MPTMANPTLDALYARRSVRNYQARPVERKKLVTLLEAAMAAPSACNIQPWEFIVVTEPERVAAIKETITKWGNWNAPVIIAVCGVPELIPWPGDDGQLDCAAAIENILVAAPSLGLGGVWVGGFNANAIREVLGIPNEIVPNGLVYVGYPAEEPEPRTQYREDAVHWEQYDAEHKPAPRDGRIV